MGSTSTEPTNAHETYLIDDYIDFLYYDMRDFEPSRPDNAGRLPLATYLLGRAAYLAVLRDTDPDDIGLFHQAYIELDRHTESTTGQDRAEGQVFEAVATLLQFPADAERTAENQNRLHTRIVKALALALDRPDHFRYGPSKRPSPQQREDIDTVTRYTALGLLTRRQDDRWLAVPALHYQSDRQSRSPIHNFSMAVIEDCDEELRAHKVQVTANCLAFCGQETDRQIAKRNLLRRQHASDISLISGCCDLDLHFPDSGIDAPASSKLAFEQAGTAMEYDADELDAYGRRLLQLIAEDPERKGLWE